MLSSFQLDDITYSRGITSLRSQKKNNDVVAENPRLESVGEKNILFITWNVSERVTQFLRDNCSTCTIVQKWVTSEGINGWEREDNCFGLGHPMKQSHKARLEKSYDEIIFVCQTPFHRKDFFCYNTFHLIFVSKVLFTWSVITITIKKLWPLFRNLHVFTSPETFVSSGNQ